MMFKSSALTDEQFQQALHKMKDTLKETLGEHPHFGDMIEVLNTMLIAGAFSTFTAAGIKDTQVIEEQMGQLLRIFTVMYQQYTETYLTNFDKFKEIVDAQKAKMSEQFSDLTGNLDNAQKEMMDMFAKFGVDTTKMKQ